jgi:hypothetical protein
MFMKNVILKTTHRIWNREISRILCRAKETGKINSEQLHILASAFDPTQISTCQVGKPNFFPWHK